MAKPKPATIITDKIGARNTAKNIKVFRSYFFCCSGVVA
jgi:hypothetical protein